VHVGQAAMGRRIDGAAGAWGGGAFRLLVYMLLYDGAFRGVSFLGMIRLGLACLHCTLVSSQGAERALSALCLLLLLCMCMMYMMVVSL